MFNKAEYMKVYRKDNRDERRRIVDEALGTCCVLCLESPHLLVAHRKDGSVHPKFQWQLPEWIEKELATGEYVRLCALCHKAVHWCMEKMNMSWEGIRARCM